MSDADIDDRYRGVGLRHGERTARGGCQHASGDGGLKRVPTGDIQWTGELRDLLQAA